MQHREMIRFPFCPTLQKHAMQICNLQTVLFQIKVVIKKKNADRKQTSFNQQKQLKLSYEILKWNYCLFL